MLVDRALWLVVGAMLLAGIATSYTISTLRINTSTTDMISAEVPFRRHHVEFVQAFPAFTNTIVAVIDAGTPEAADQAATALSNALAGDREHFVAVDYPQGEPFFASEGLLYLKQDALSQLSERLAAAQPLLAVLAASPTLQGLADFMRLVVEQSPADAAPSAALDTLLADMATVVNWTHAGQPGALSWQRQLQPDTGAMTRRLVIAEPTRDDGSLAPAAPAIAALHAHAKELGLDADHGIELHLTGSVVIDEEELASVGRSTSQATVISTLGVLGLLIWGLGSFRLILATMLTLLIGLAITAGLATLLVGRLNLISVTFAVLFVGIGVDFGIHVALRYRQALQLGPDLRAALGETVGALAGPLTMVALCASLGFLAFVPTSYEGLAELGIISALGMVVALVTSLVLMPALLALLPLPAHSARPGARPDWTRRVARLRWPILALAAIGVVASLPIAPALTFDINPLNLKDPKSEAVATFRQLARDADTSPYNIDILAVDLDHADQVIGQLQEVPEVGSVVSLRSFVPTDQEAKLELIDQMALYLDPVLTAAPAAPLSSAERRQAFEALVALLQQAHSGALSGQPGAEQLAEALQQFAELPPTDAQLADLEQRLTGTLPELLDRLRQSLNAQPVTLDNLPDSLRDRWRNPTGQIRLMVRPATPITDDVALARFADAVLAVVPEATGTPVILVEAGRVVRAAFWQASWLALAAITVLLAIVLRNVVDVILVLLPIGLAALLAAATAVMAGMALNFANVIAVPLLLGLGVSGAVNVVMREGRGRPRPAGSWSSTARGVTFSTFTTIAAFGSLAIAAHRGLASMGLLLTIAVVWSLICTVIVLPCLLAVFGRLPPLAKPNP